MNSSPSRSVLSLALAMALVALGPLSVANAGGVALLPLETSSQSGDAEIIELQDTLSVALAKVEAQFISPSAVAKRLQQAKKRALIDCGDERQCLKELVSTLAADKVVRAELAGLGTAKVVYLQALDASGAQSSSTTLELGPGVDAGAASYAAAVRLLTPDRYLGYLTLSASMEGSRLFVDGLSRGNAPLSKLELDVGSHAVRVTHPERGDYVRFVDIEFGEETQVSATLPWLPGAAGRLELEGELAGERVTQKRTKKVGQPWYLSWPVLTGGFLAVGAASAAIYMGAYKGGSIEADVVRDLP